MKRIIELNLDCLDPDLAEFLLVSGKVRTRQELMRRALLDWIDPMIATGAEFEFEDRPEGDGMYISLDVPDIGSTVDLAVCWKIAQADAKACALTLERDHSIEGTLRVYKNTLDWLKFWSWRHPNDRLREGFERQLQERKAKLEALKEEAGYKFKFGLLEELKAI